MSWCWQVVVNVYHTLYYIIINATIIMNQEETGIKIEKDDSAKLDSRG